MKNIWLKHKTLIIILGYILLVGLSVYLLAGPLVSRIEISSNQIQGKLIDQQIERARMDSLPQMKEDWSNFESKKGSLEVILSSRNELEFIESIEAIADKTENTISLKIGDSADPKAMARVKKVNDKKDSPTKEVLEGITYANFFPVQINLKGDYTGLVNFIHMLENSRFYVNVISLEVKKYKMDDSQEFSSRDTFSLNAGSSVVNDNKKEIISTDVNAIVYTEK